MSVRLSICIATFNRARFIGETIRSMAPQLTSGCEIVVLDGGSKDDTAQVIAALQQEVPGLRYVRQDRNRGVDRDFDAAVLHASGDYCWLMSDDDLFKPGAVAAVLQALAREPSLVVVNAELRSLDLSELLDPRRLPLADDRVYAPAEFDRLFAETSAYLTYIGAVVVRRALWLARDRESCFGSEFIHVGVVFQQPLPAGAVVLATPYISVRFGNTQWRPREFEIRMVRWTELVWWLPAVPDAVRARLYRRDPWRSFKSLFFYRAKGTYSLTEYRRWVAPRVHTLPDRARAIAVALVPGVLANLAGLLFCLLPYRDSGIHFRDMRASRFYLPNVLRRATSGTAAR